MVTLWPSRPNIGFFTKALPRSACWVSKAGSRLAWPGKPSHRSGSSILLERIIFQAGSMKAVVSVSTWAPNSSRTIHSQG